MATGDALDVYGMVIERATRARSAAGEGEVGAQGFYKVWVSDAPIEAE